MNVKIISVGTEVLTGKCVNTNAAYLAEKLTNFGCDITKIVVVGDDVIELKKELSNSDENIVITTGGLGPTIDDFTKEVVCEFLNLNLYLDERALERIKKYYLDTNREMKDTNIKQAFFPKDSLILYNENGTAPGVIIDDNKTIYILLPGPPYEMKPMFESIEDYLKDKSNKKLYIKGYRLVGIGESDCEKILTSFYEKHPKVYIAPYASYGEIKYMFSSTSEDYVDKAREGFYTLFKEYIVSDYNESFESVIVNSLKDKKLKISFAESCTGGLLVSRIVDYPSASSVLDESLITYSNESKIKYLNVRKETLDKYGAVSNECVSEMASGLYELTKSDVCVSVSGIAGPTGGTIDKPVGTVFFGISYKGKVRTYHRLFLGDRKIVRQLSVVYALDLVRKVLS